MIKKILTAIASLTLAVGVTPTTAQATSKINFEGEKVVISSDEMQYVNGEISFTTGMYTFDINSDAYRSIEEGTVYTVINLNCGEEFEVTLTPTGKFREGTELSIFGNYFVRPMDSDINTYKGDINIDGRKNIADLIQLYRYTTNRVDFRTMSYHRADINNDGIVDVFDIVKMREQVINNVG